MRGSPNQLPPSKNRDVVLLLAILQAVDQKAIRVANQIAAYMRICNAIPIRFH